VKKPDECPECGYSVVRTVCTSGRKLVHACDTEAGCGWRGEPFTPPRRRIASRKTVHLDGGWHYELFDGRGHVMTYSRTYSSKKQAEDAALAEMENTAKSKVGHHYGEMTAIIWPATVKVQGKVIRMKKRKKR
jgi:hypothetical protein